MNAAFSEGGTCLIDIFFLLGLLYLRHQRRFVDDLRQPRHYFLVGRRVQEQLVRHRLCALAGQPQVRT